MGEDEVTDFAKLARLFEKGMSVADARDAAASLSDSTVLPRLMIRALGVARGSRAAAIFNEGVSDANSAELAHLLTGRFDVATAQGIAIEAAAYEGPLDLVPGAIFAYSASRALSTVMVGQPLFTLQRVGGGNPTQAFSTGANGTLADDTVTAFLSGDVGKLTIWNDQSGGARHLEAQGVTTTKWLPNMLGTKPGFERVGDQHFYSALDGIFQAGMTIFHVSNHLMTITEASLDGPFIELFAGASVFATITSESDADYANGSVDTVVDGTGIHLRDVGLDQTGGSYRQDGVLYAFDSFETLGTVVPFAMGLDLAFDSAGAQDVELLIYPTKLSDADRLLIRQNIATYYGITLT